MFIASVPGQSSALPEDGRARYPVNFRRRVRVAGDQELLVRSIEPGDVGLMAKFHATLSEETVRSRYFHYVALHARVADARLSRICAPDPQVEAVLVAVVEDEADGPRIVGVGRLEEMNPRVGEVAAVISDAWQHKGVGSTLVQCLIELARSRGLSDLHAYILPENTAMQRLCQRLGFKVGFSMNLGTLKAHLPLSPYTPGN